MNHIKDNHEQEEDRKAKWEHENRDALRDIEYYKNLIEDHKVEIDKYEEQIKSIKKQIGWQE